MYTVYLAGPVTHDSDPDRWREEIQESNNMNIIEFNDPTNVEVDGKLLVEEQLQRLKSCDAVLVRLKDKVPTYGTPMEMVYAQAYDIPVVVWHDGQELSPWVMYHSNDEAQEGNDAVQAILESL
jgi:nucleoside 2-deoxyribosyltransferase